METKKITYKEWMELIGTLDKMKFPKTIILKEEDFDSLMKQLEPMLGTNYRLSLDVGDVAKSESFIFANRTFIKHKTNGKV